MVKGHWQRLAVIGAALALTVLASHAIIRWLNIGTRIVGWRATGEPSSAGDVWLAGSSLAGDALALDHVSRALGRRLVTWFVAGGSPAEWEHFQPTNSAFSASLVCVSIYDLNEEFLCDFRADVIPLKRAVEDTVTGRSSWGLAKRVLGQYALTWLRVPFPTAGRSQGVMGGLKDKARSLLAGRVRLESEHGPRMDQRPSGEADPEKRERLGDWSPGALQSRLAKLRAACQGRSSFDGPKHFALRRLLHGAAARGRVILVVLPVSTAYQEELVSSETQRRFDKALDEARQACPEVDWIRLDRMPGLEVNEHFWDPVHMNVFGQERATREFLRQLGANSPAR